LKDEEKDRKLEPTASSQESGAVADKDEAKRESKTTTNLEWRDWVALTIASLETILLPAVAIIVVLMVLAILFGHFW
jgi:uncharacterized membrane protein YdfJ with MMPL/SSD domain